MLRQPRPQGTTYLSIKYQEHQSDHNRQMVYRHLVSIYTLNGFRWNGKPTSIAQLSFILRIPTQEIMGHVSNFGTNMGNLATTENIESTLKSIITLSTSWAIQDRGLIAQQVDQLLKSQDGKYKPFITAEVNKSLKLILESNKNLMDTYKTFFTSTNTTTNILNVQAKANQDNDQDYLSPDDALILINKNNGNQLPAHKPGSVPDMHAQSDTAILADQLYQEYGVGDLQDVRERRSGTEALQSPEAIMGSHKGLQSPPAQPSHNDDGGFTRRGLAVEDTDSLPAD